MTCPVCGVENTPSAQYCDCGYEFVPGSKPKELVKDEPQGTLCAKCEALNPSTNQFCGKCGKPFQKSASPTISPLLIIVLGLVTVGAIAVTLNIGRNESGTLPSSRGQLESSASTNATQQAIPEPGSQWDYSSDEDAMGRKRMFARITSTNTLRFGSPYDGSQHGMLTIRRTSQSGTNVIVNIERGQFLCGIEECAVNVRFDAGPIQRFSASEPADHSSTVLFLNGEAGFITQLRKAKIVRIEATFYQEGSRSLEFCADGFKWQ